MITSKDNKLIKLCNQIKTKKYSKEMGLCLVETIKVVSQLYLKGLIKNILVTEEKYNLIKDYKNAQIDIVSDSIIDYLSDAVTSDGVLAICEIPKNNSINYSKCLILDNIQDPSNIGAIIRSARAFSYDTIFAVNSVYPYTYKCIRASMGYVFDINYIDTTYEKLLKIKEKYNLIFVSADMDGEIVEELQVDPQKLALIIDNEGQGVSRILRTYSDKTVSIPMQNDVESLNASVSAGILMYLLK